MKKTLSIFLASLLLLAALAGCAQSSAPSASGSATPSPSSGADPSEAPPEGVNITLAHCQGEWSWPLMEDIMNAYGDLSGNTIELLFVPSDAMADWTTTQFAGGTAPDILWSASMPAGDYYKSGWIIDLKPYYNDVSPYTGEAWRDSFYPDILLGVIDPNGTGTELGMPLSVVTVNLYYNTGILNDVGVDGGNLKSWTDVLNAAKKVKESGKDIVPFSVQNSIRWNLGWIENFCMESIWYDVVPTLDIISSPDSPAPNKTLELPEQIVGVKTGIMDPGDSRMVDYFRFMKEFADYFNNGFNTASWEYEALFNEGKSAMTMNGSWFPNQVVQNELTVEFGVGPMPYVDAAISPKSENRLRLYSTGRGGPDLMVSQKAKDDGRADAAVDFLRFLSDPSTGAKLMAEKLMSIPVVKGVDVPASMEGLTKYLGDDLQNVGYKLNVITPEQESKYNVMFADFLVNDTTPEDFAKEFKKLVEAACDDAIAEHPEWEIQTYIDRLGQ